MRGTNLPGKARGGFFLCLRRVIIFLLIGGTGKGPNYGRTSNFSKGFFGATNSRRNGIPPEIACCHTGSGGPTVQSLLIATSSSRNRIMTFPLELDVIQLLSLDDTCLFSFHGSAIRWIIIRKKRLVVYL